MDTTQPLRHPPSSLRSHLPHQTLPGVLVQLSRREAQVLEDFMNASQPLCHSSPVSSPQPHRPHQTLPWVVDLASVVYLPGTGINYLNHRPLLGRPVWTTTCHPHHQ